MEESNAKNPRFSFERRKRPRFLMELPLEYRKADGPKMRPGHTVNFSEDGLMVLGSEQMAIGEKLEMKIYFSSGSGFVTIPAIVKVVWLDIDPKEDGYYRFGVNFINISPVDMQSLKEFLKIYADPHQAHAELKPPTSTSPNPHKSFTPELPRR